MSWNNQYRGGGGSSSSHNQRRNNSHNSGYSGHGGRSNQYDHQGQYNDETFRPVGHNLPRPMFHNMRPNAPWLNPPYGLPGFNPPPFGSYMDYSQWNRAPQLVPRSDDRPKKFDKKKTPDHDSRDKLSSLKSQDKVEAKQDSDSNGENSSEQTMVQKPLEMPESLLDSNKEALSPVSSGSKGPQSPPPFSGTNSRRKQSTPQKVPAGSSPTNIITKKGLTLPDTANINKNKVDVVKAPVDETQESKTNPSDKEAENESLDLNVSKAGILKCSSLKKEELLSKELKSNKDNEDEMNLNKNVHEIAQKNLNNSLDVTPSTSLVSQKNMTSTTGTIPFISTSIPPCNPNPITLPRRSKGEMKSYSEIPPVIPSSEPKHFISPPRRTARNRERKNSGEEESMKAVEEIAPLKDDQITVMTNDSKKVSTLSSDVKKGELPSEITKVNKDTASLRSFRKPRKEKVETATNKMELESEEAKEKLSKSLNNENSSLSEAKIETCKTSIISPDILTPRSKRMSAHKALMSIKNSKDLTDYAIERSKEDYEKRVIQTKNIKIIVSENKRDASETKSSILNDNGSEKNAVQVDNVDECDTDKKACTKKKDEELLPFNNSNELNTSHKSEETRKDKDKEMKTPKQRNSDLKLNNKNFVTPKRTSSRLTSPNYHKSDELTESDKSITITPKTTEHQDMVTTPKTASDLNISQQILSSSTPNNCNENVLPPPSDMQLSDSIDNSTTRRNPKRKVTENTSLTSDSECEDKKSSKRRRGYDSSGIEEATPTVLQTRTSARKRNHRSTNLSNENVKDKSESVEISNNDVIEDDEVIILNIDKDSSESGKTRPQRTRKQLHVTEIEDSETENIAPTPTSTTNTKSQSKKKDNTNVASKRTIDETSRKETSPLCTNKKKKGSDWKGPFIRIEGVFHSPRVVTVINSENNDERKDTQKKRGLHDAEHRARSANVGYFSTLSKDYNQKNVDESWKCALCKRGTHFRGLGDLFGPYWIKIENISKVGPVSKGNKRKRSQNGEQEFKCQEEETEVWFHEECIVWIPGVYILGSRIIGMEEGVNLCLETRCMVCKEPGASLGCTKTGCRNAVHIPCAMDTPWIKHLETFKATCPDCNTNRSV